jgi:putative ABC transport system permease protein
VLKNYFKTAFRNIWRHKSLSFINIFGLSIGLACVMLILLFVNDEYSFDKFQAKGDRIVRLVQTFTDTSGQQFRQGNSGVPQGPAYSAQIPEIEAYCRLKGWPMTVKKGTEGLESRVLFVDTSFFNVFSFDVQRGNAAHLLQGRSSVVLSEATAIKYFGKEDPIGKTVDIEVDDDFEPFVVTGIVANAPTNSSVQFDMLIPFERQFPVDAAERTEMENNWSSQFLNTFFLLRKNADRQQAEAKLLTVYQQVNKKGWEEQKAHLGSKSRLQLFLQPFFTMHLDDQFFASNGLQNWSDSTYSYILSGLAILLLVIACINFINITLARSIRRNKEVGIRKVSGGSRRQLMFQFLSESAVVTALAFLPAFALVQLCLPTFSQLAQKHFDITYLFQARVLLLFIALWIVVSLLAGAYPAFVASGFKPAITLYGRLKLSNKNLLGKSLVVTQFVIALALIISMVVFNRQFNYMTKNADLGFNTNNIIRVQFPWGKKKELALLKHELSLQPSIEMVGSKAGDQNKTKFSINNKETEYTYFEYIDDKYLQTMGIPLTKGRYLSYSNVIDTVSTCLVNQAFVDELLDKTQSPIGQIVSRPKSNVSYEVVGIVKNYHLASFKEKIEPVFYSLDKRGNNFNTFVKYAPGQAKAATTALTASFKALMPYATLDYNYMDDWNRQRYESEEQWKNIITYSAIIAILVSCLGLFALATLSVEQRVKEIGIRKVLGASVANITAMLSKDFLKLVLIAFVIATPVAGYFTYNWLQDFAYRVSLNAWIFIGTGALIVLVALATISFHTIRSAIMNPVKSLRSE